MIDTSIAGSAVAEVKRHPEVVWVWERGCSGVDVDVAEEFEHGAGAVERDGGEVGVDGGELGEGEEGEEGVEIREEEVEFVVFALVGYGVLQEGEEAWVRFEGGWVRFWGDGGCAAES